MAACCFARVLAIASTIIPSHNAPAQYRDIVRSRTLPRSEFANSLPFPIHWEKWASRHYLHRGNRK